MGEEDDEGTNTEGEEAEYDELWEELDEEERAKWLSARRK